MRANPDELRKRADAIIFMGQKANRDALADELVALRALAEAAQNLVQVAELDIDWSRYVPSDPAVLILDDAKTALASWAALGVEA